MPTPVAASQERPRGSIPDLTWGRHMESRELLCYHGFGSGAHGQAGSPSSAHLILEERL